MATIKQIKTDIIESLKDGLRDTNEVVEEISYENQVSEQGVELLIKEMAKLGWIIRYDGQISLRYPYRSY